jgi:hypothetical protein
VESHPFDSALDRLLPLRSFLRSRLHIGGKDWAPGPVILSGVGGREASDNAAEGSLARWN